MGRGRKRASDLFCHSKLLRACLIAPVHGSYRTIGCEVCLDLCLRRGRERAVDLLRIGMIFDRELGKEVAADLLQVECRRIVRAREIGEDGAVCPGGIRMEICEEGKEALRHISEPAEDDGPHA